jgi:hypothetical protein
MYASQQSHFNQNHLIHENMSLEKGPVERKIDVLHFKKYTLILLSFRGNAKVSLSNKKIIPFIFLYLHLINSWLQFLQLR